jgi:hypothetical protein
VDSGRIDPDSVDWLPTYSARSLRQEIVDLLARDQSDDPGEQWFTTLPAPAMWAQPDLDHA